MFAIHGPEVKDGPSFTEELLAFDDAKHTYKYRIIESPLPLRDYVSHITVTPGAWQAPVASRRGSTTSETELLDAPSPIPFTAVMR